MLRLGLVRRIAVVTVATVLTGAAAGSGAWAHSGLHAPVGQTAVETRDAAFDFKAPVPGTYRLPVIKPAPDGVVLDANGRRRRLHELMAGKVVVLSFVYTQCTDARGCPLATAVLYQVHQVSASDPVLAANMKLITLSFDPAHDTPAVMARYARPQDSAAARGSAWDRLTTDSERTLAPILAGYGQLVTRPAPGATGGLSHRLRVYLIDRGQQIRNIYGLDFLDPRLLLADVQTQLHDERTGRR